MKHFCCFGLMLVSVSLHAQLTDFRHVRFSRADSIAYAHADAPLFDIPLLSAKLTQALATEEEKFRAIFQWVCNNIDFDVELLRLNDRKRRKCESPEALEAWNKKAVALTYRKLVLEKKTVCTGYAWLVHELAQHAGITCVIVDGYGRSASGNIRKSGLPNHSWNAVMLNGKWYLCDPTWASGIYDREGEFIRQYNESYFLPDPIVFIRNHYPLDSVWTLLRDRGSSFDKLRTTLEAGGSKPGVRSSNDEIEILDSKPPTLQEFLNGPLIYSSAYEHGLTKIYPETFDIVTWKDEPVYFRFESSKQMERIELAVNKDLEKKSYQPVFGKDDEGLYSFHHTFAEKGRHVVHVMLNGNYAVTYTVTVR